MTYENQTRPGKEQVSGNDIANGAISLRHLSAELFSELKKIALHPHTGVNSVKIKLQDLDGSFTRDGFLMRSPNGSLWRIQVDNSGALAATAV